MLSIILRLMEFRKKYDIVDIVESVQVLQMGDEIPESILYIKQTLRILHVPVSKSPTR